MEMKDVKNEENIKECQKYLLILLKFFHKICVENNIKYTLEAGTMLGAIREKGFIPWDDDCDVSLVREEYDKLINILKNYNFPEEIGVNFPEEHNEFLDFNIRLYYKDKIIRTDEKSKNEYGGLYMYPMFDIFPMDYVPKNYIKRRIYVLKQQIVFGLAMSKRHTIKSDKYIKKYGIITQIGVNILSKIGKLFSLKSIINIHYIISRKYLNTNAEYLYCTGWEPLFPGWLYKKEWYEKVHLTPFEDDNFFVVDNFEEALTVSYGGNWIKPEKTHTHADFVDQL